MKRTLTYLLLVIGLTGFIFFKNYQGDIVRYPNVWLLLSFIVIVLSGYLLVSLSRHKNEFDSKDEQDRSKHNFEKIKIDFECCTFKTNHFQQEISLETPSSSEVYDGIIHRDRIHKTEEKKQTVLVYEYTSQGRTEKFVSQPFPIDEVVLKYYVIKGEVLLYIDKVDRSKYVFELQN